MKPLFLLLLLPFVTNGQNKTTSPGKVSFGLNFSPDYCYRTLKSDGSVSSNFIVDTREDLEIAQFGYTGGISICVDLSKRIALETGFQYSNKGYKTRPQGLYYAQPSGPPGTIEFFYDFKYLSIPLKARCILGNSKARFVAAVGMTTNFLIEAAETARREYPDGSYRNTKQSSTPTFNRVDIAAIVSTGISYKMTQRTELVGEPTFRYSLLKVKDAPVTEHLWNIGLNVGVYYRLHSRAKK